MTKKIKLFFLMTLICACAQNNQNYIGSEYLGQKYINNPLGEEKFPDADPLIRYDAFDCTTFVETSLANGDVDKLNKIRYKNGNMDFLNRNHFTELDWLQNNKDIVENVSSKYGKTSIRNIIVDKKNWFKKVHNINTNFEKQTVDIEYIAYSDLEDIKNDETLIVLFISGNPKIYDKIGTDLAVVHMGFLLPNGMLRHASQKWGCVIDEDFKTYIKSRMKNKNNLGIALVKIK